MADQVFQALARAILRGELPSRKPLAPQRELARQFSVSPLVVRQAVHRLEDLGLVRVRQGSTTIVLDPEQSSDPRLMRLRLELSGDAGGHAPADAEESQLLFVLPLLALAERRIQPDELAVLDYVVRSAEARGVDQGSADAFRHEYWTQLAKAARNGVFQQQLAWWAQMRADLPAPAPKRKPASAAPLSFAFYHGLNRCLAAGEGTVAYFLRAVDARLAGLESRRGLPTRRDA